MSVPLRIAFIGGGEMATALGAGLLQSGTLPNNSTIIVSDPIQTQLDKLLVVFEAQKQTENVVHCQTTQNNKECIANADVVFIAVKPQYLLSVTDELHTCFRGNELIISMVTGATLDTLQSSLSNKSTQPMIRIMPNTPALIGAGVTAMMGAKYATHSHLALADTLLRPCGLVVELHDEGLLDAVTGLSGSGPAYIFILIEALADGGVQCGLMRSDALKLAAQTVLGSAKLVLESGLHPAELKDSVACAGGTTIAAIKSLEKNAFRYAVIAAVEAATNRSRELAVLSAQKSKSKL